MATTGIGPLTSEIAGILRGRAGRYGITQAQLAEYTKVGQSQVSKMLRGLRPIDLDDLAGMCHALGLEIEDVVAEAYELVSDELWRELPDRYIIENRLVREPSVGGSSDAAARDALPDLPEGVTTKRKDDVDLAAERGADGGDESRDSRGTAS